ncbi:uncharacterized protein LOC127245768 [Andrographis paniculata]|uniref:uncharacterized protein LOC127245768 n=1 Tax=Andrographis paniculata TaxID=175694 RepID=UPI0021E72608|nr:uncharacterized protein LOC127245768 [Andrographis paniculata]
MQQRKQERDIKKTENGDSSWSLRKIRHPTHDHAIRKKKEEPYVHSAAANKACFKDKKSKKSPLSNELVTTNAPILLPVKKHPSPPATKLPQKQAQVSSKTSHSYKQVHLQSKKIFAAVEPGKTSRCPTNASAAAEEYRYYIQWILTRSGIGGNATPLNSGAWHTSTHPLDPSIFHYLELFHPSGSATLSHRCNRKLIFQLVDELLADILRLRLDIRPRISPVSDNYTLIDELCNKIEGYPAANCQVLEDIDSLIGKDLSESQLPGQSEVEWEGLVREIEGEIMDSLVRETAAMVAVRAAG